MIPVLETERLILRAPIDSDFEADVEFFASERSSFVGGPMDREMVWRVLATSLGHWVLRGYGRWSVEEKATGLYCGQVGHWYPESWPEPEIGWSLVEAAEGRGIAQEAAVASLRHAYQTLGWTTCISLIDFDNTRSIATAERMGAVYEKPFTHARFGDMGIWRHKGPGETI